MKTFVLKTTSKLRSCNHPLSTYERTSGPNRFQIGFETGRWVNGLGESSEKWWTWRLSTNFFSTKPRVNLRVVKQPALFYVCTSCSHIPSGSSRISRTSFFSGLQVRACVSRSWNEECISIWRGPTFVRTLVVYVLLTRYDMRSVFPLHSLPHSLLFHSRRETSWKRVVGSNSLEPHPLVVCIWLKFTPLSLRAQWLDKIRDPVLTD